jgi:hypothetical protein
MYKFSKNLKLVKYYKEPEIRYNIVSVTVFRLYNNYKPMDKYYEKFNLFLKVFKKYMPNFYLRVYIDNSLIVKPGIKIIDDEIDNIWIPLINKLKSLDFVQLIKYKHKDFLDEKYPQCHKGTFGTIIRFLPMFNYEINNKLDTIVIMDIDMSPKSFDLYNNIINYSKKNNLHFMFRTSYCKYTKSRHFIVSEITNTWLRVMAGTIVLMNHRFDKNILNEFFGCIKNNTFENKCKYISLFKDHVNLETNVYNKKVSDELFIYGIDELFALYLLDSLIKQNIKFGYLASKDIDVPLYTHSVKYDTYSDNTNEINKKLLKNIAGKYYDDTKSLQENFKFIDENLSNNIFNKNINEASKEIMKNYINLFKEIKNNNYINEYGFNKEEIKCVIKQENKNSFDNYSIFTDEDKDNIKFILN